MEAKVEDAREALSVDGGGEVRRRNLGHGRLAHAVGEANAARWARYHRGECGKVHRRRRGPRRLGVDVRLASGAAIRFRRHPAAGIAL